jgi:hypothetical protein
MRWLYITFPLHIKDACHGDHLIPPIRKPHFGGEGVK